MEEIWRPIPEFEGAYLVSNLGKIKSVDRVVNGYNGQKTKKGKVLTEIVNHKGYCRVGVSFKGVSRSITVHRFVAKAFLPNPENKNEVNHINGNKKDNRSENLEWCTRSENMKHAAIAGLLNQKGDNNNFYKHFYKVVKRRKMVERPIKTEV